MWERVAYLEHCGSCGRELTVDEPVQTITRYGLRRKLFRGTCCADGPAPANLPARPKPIELTDQIHRMKTLSTAMPPRTRGALKQMAQDTARPEWMPYKENREPGEDG